MHHENSTRPLAMERYGSGLYEEAEGPVAPYIPQDLLEFLERAYAQRRLGVGDTMAQAQRAAGQQDVVLFLRQHYEQQQE